MTKAAAILEVLEDDLTSQVGPALLTLITISTNAAQLGRTEDFDFWKFKETAIKTPRRQYSAEHGRCTHRIQMMFSVRSEVILLIWLPAIC